VNTNTRSIVAAGVLAALTTLSTTATPRYVWQESPSPGPPYDTWANAAHDIQTAVDAAQPGEEIVVTNGVYATGGRAVGTNVLVNRVAVDKPLTLRSVNGPEVTIIEGAKAPGGDNGDGAIRCVYMAESASLSGFTLTNGATRAVWSLDSESSGGGAWCTSTNAVLTNCVLTGNLASLGGGAIYCGTLNNCTLRGNSTLGFIVTPSSGGGAYGATLNNCVLTNNSAYGYRGVLKYSEGGGACKCTLYNCTLSGNQAVDGGGAFGCTLCNCTLTGNSAPSSEQGYYYDGGGAYGCTLYNCLLTGNSNRHGGGAYGWTLYNCTLTGNSALSYGGGAYRSTLDNCTLTANSDGGAFLCTLNNCTLTSNSAWEGGGACGGTLTNCVLTGNSASKGGGAYDSALNNCTLAGNAAYDDGAGAYGGTLNNCTLTRNAAEGNGGGAYRGTLNNCTLTANSALLGGGAFEGTLNNCIVYFNTAPYGANYSGGTLDYCCTTPMPSDGVGNITNAPLFVDTNGWIDLRLQPNSPCIDAGTNLAGLIATDLLGLPRPMDGNGDGIARFDIGAYEFNPYRFEPALQMSGDGFWFTVRGEPGRSVRIERSRDLVNWEYAGEVPIPACGQTLIDPAATTEPRLFYRALRVP